MKEALLIVKDWSGVADSNARPVETQGETERRKRIRENCVRYLPGM